VHNQPRPGPPPPSWVGRAIVLLADGGHKGDRRRHVLSLTAKGRRASQESEQTAQQVTDRVLSRLTADERRTLHRLTLRALGEPEDTADAPVPGSSRPPHVSRHGAARDLVEGDDARIDVEVVPVTAVAPPTLVAHERPGRLGERRVELRRVGRRRFTGGYELRRVPRGRYPFEAVRLIVEDPFALARVASVRPADEPGKRPPRPVRRPRTRRRTCRELGNRRRTG